MSNPIAKWVLLRFIAPLTLGSVITIVTWGNNVFDVFGPLVWTLFVSHLLATFTFKQTHVLDTGSFFCLIFGCGLVADISEARHIGNIRAWAFLALIYIVYAFLSFVGRTRAVSMNNNRKSVGIGHVITAITFLFIAIVVCSTSKVAVGFLFVPGFLLIPIILLFALVNRESPSTNAR